MSSGLFFTGNTSDSVNYLRVPENPRVIETLPMTIAAWVYRASLADSAWFWSRVDYSSAGINLGFTEFSNDSVYLFAGGGYQAGGSGQGGSAVPVGWSLISWAVDSLGNWDVRIGEDVQRSGTGFTHSPCVNSRDLLIGGEMSTNGGTLGQEDVGVSQLGKWDGRIPDAALSAMARGASFPAGYNRKLYIDADKPFATPENGFIEVVGSPQRIAGPDVVKEVRYV